MTALGVQSLLAMLLGTVAFAYVLRRRDRNQIRASLLCVLGGLVLWTGGMLVMELSQTQPLARLGLSISFLGASVLGPAWLFLAARYTRNRRVECQPELLLAAAAPAALGFLALLTNDGHRLFAETLTREALARGALAWAGPIFWASLVWQLSLVAVGVVMLLRHASRSVSVAQRRHAQIIGMVGALPILAAVVRHLDLLPGDFDPIPAATAFAVAATFAVTMRYRLLDFLPMARRDVIDALDDAVILTDAHGMVLDLNPAAHALLGWPSRPLRDQPLARLLARLAPESELPGLQGVLETALLSGSSESIPLQTRSGRELEVDVGSVMGRDDEPSARFAVVRDLTERRRLERMLRESQQRVVVGGIAAALAHEVNNPLAFVASNLRQVYRVTRFDDFELARFEDSRAKDLAELSEVLRETIGGVERIAGTIGRIIQPAGLSEEEVVRLQLDDVVDDAVQLVACHGPSPVRTHVESMRQLPTLEGSPERLAQALLNLLLNAQTAAASLRDASLHVDAATDGDWVALRLRVRGPDGSPWPEALPPCTPDESADEPGLSAAYETVREHGGTLEAGGAAGLLFELRQPTA